jgi:hypothetical protein
MPAGPADSPQAGGGAAHAPKCALGVIWVVAVCLLLCAFLQDLLTRHKQVVAQFLQDNFTRFFDAFSALLQSNNYVTRRQSLKVQLASSPLGIMHGKCRGIQLSERVVG